MIYQIMNLSKISKVLRFSSCKPIPSVITHGVSDVQTVVSPSIFFTYSPSTAHHETILLNVVKNIINFPILNVL